MVGWGKVLSNQPQSFQYSQKRQQKHSHHCPLWSFFLPCHLRILRRLLSIGHCPKNQFGSAKNFNRFCAFPIRSLPAATHVCRIARPKDCVESIKVWPSIGLIPLHESCGIDLEKQSVFLANCIGPCSACHNSPTIVCLRHRPRGLNIFIFIRAPSTQGLSQGAHFLIFHK